MKSNVMQDQIQPFVKLTQANMELVTRFSASPEVTSQAIANASQALHQASESTMKVMQSEALVQLMQGMLRNYIAFLTELNQNAMALMSEGQVAFTQQADETTAAVIDAKDARGRRARRAA